MRVADDLITIPFEEGRMSFKRILCLISLSIIFNSLLTTSSIAQNKVVKNVCLSSFGMNWKTSEEAQNHLLFEAKRGAVGELFGEMVRSLSEVQNFVLTKDEIQSFSSGFIRIEGSPDFYNGKGAGELCVKITAYIKDSDMVRFQPKDLRRKVCIADPRYSLGEIRKIAEQQARIQAVRDFEPSLTKVKDDVVLNLIHESKTDSAGFIPETETYCVTITGKVYPAELMAVQEKTGADKKIASQAEPTIPFMNNSLEQTVNKSLIGKWEGRGCQSGGSCWTIHIDIPRETENKIADGIIKYPSLNCEARLEFVKWEKETAIFRERYTKVGSCVQNGWLYLTKKDANILDFVWAYPNGKKGAHTEVIRVK